MATDKILYQGKLLSLLRREVFLPDRRKASLEMLKHPGAALIVPFVSDKEIILLRQFRPAVGAYLYELPAGTLNKGERPLSCARREIKEETGCSARRFTLLGSIYPVPGYSTEKIYIYRAEGLAECHGHKPEEDEFIQKFRAVKARVRNLFRQRKIQDAKTICALALCGWI